MTTQPKTIKMIGTKHFEVELFEMPDGKYCIRYHVRRNEGHDYSENIKDYHTAAFMFDMKVRELEGV